MLHTTAKELSFRPAADLARSLHCQQIASPQELLNADRHRVLLLTLEPGDTLPEQLHLYANKTLMVMEGCASILYDNSVKVLHEGESYALASCIRHRITNSGKIPLRILEIRSGACVEDNDHAA